MSKQKQGSIRIFDDEDGLNGLARRMEDGLRKVATGFLPQVLSNEEFKKDLDVLRQRRHATRSKQVNQTKNEKKTIFDETDILIVDYDLETFADGFATGEEVAYLARCYSNCKLIIAINQFVSRGANYFDLTLKGSPTSFADLNLTSTQLGSPGLWQEQWTKPLFRPWYWPLIPRALADYKNRLNSLHKDGALDMSITKTLEFPETLANSLPRAFKAFVGKHEDLQSVTFREFVEKSGNGLRAKDAALDDAQIARIAAARLSKWLEEIVLPSQHILVDAPHLVARFPSLLKRKKKEAPVFDKTVVFGCDTDATIDPTVTKQSRWSAKHWLSRPAWFWELLVGNESIVEVAQPWESEPPTVVFCEDVSRFLPRSSVREFIADLPGPFVRRFVVEPNGKEGRKYAGELQDVEYDPALKFSV
ncbi:MAG: hypothetical protein JNM09_25235 [Blastocatellia bacterium]|nr:hypothetical protein [Blastocatellia bacterium]